MYKVSNTKFTRRHQHTFSLAFSCLFLCLVLTMSEYHSAYSHAQVLAQPAHQSVVLPASLPGWYPQQAYPTSSIAWDDYDGDGDMDLAVGNANDPDDNSFANNLYRNDSGVLTSVPVWLSTETDNTMSVAWGDIDNDSYPDLIVGNDCYGASDGCASVRLYHNNQGTLNQTADWSSSETDRTYTVVLGDVDNDGDLDLAIGNNGGVNRLYRNDNGTLSAIWSGMTLNTLNTVAWGDVDSDGDLDLTVSNMLIQIYQNNNGVLDTTPLWQSTEANFSQSIAWGDVDNDGFPDLAVGNACNEAQTICHPNRIYHNEGGTLTSTPTWSSAEVDETTSIAWGDMDNDGDLDLLVGNRDAPNRLYRNDYGSLSNNAVWSSDEEEETMSVAWRDVNNDGYLDVVAGNYGQVNRLYVNTNGLLPNSIDAPDFTKIWTSNEPGDSFSLAWGDMNNDGYLDLAVGNRGQPNYVYLNEEGKLAAHPSWKPDVTDDTRSVAWGDVNNDGYLDLAVGNLGQQVRLYYNINGELSSINGWTSAEIHETFCVAWGDDDGDGDIDLAVGDNDGTIHIYRNNNGKLTPIPGRTFGGQAGRINSMVWGDANKDGHLDLAIAGAEGVFIYHNQSGEIEPTPGWSLVSGSSPSSVAWGDYDSDSYLDLAVGGQGGVRFYHNNQGMLDTVASWSTAETDGIAHSIMWGDDDGDGDLDLAVGNFLAPGRVYHNNAGVLDTSAVWSTSENLWGWCVAWGDVDNDGDLDLAFSNTNDQPNNMYRNESKPFAKHSAWATMPKKLTESVAWGDYDSDGDLDLFVGNTDGVSDLYRNDEGKLTITPVWSTTTSTNTQSIAWGDYDGDGDLDLAMGNTGGTSHIYRNDRGTLDTTPIWSTTRNAQTQSIAWGDYDGDGDLDLVLGNDGDAIQLYRNEEGIVTNAPVWQSAAHDPVWSVAWGDYDGDGDLDLAVGNNGATNRIYQNDKGTLSPVATWSAARADSTRSVAWGDYDGDGDLDLAAGNAGSLYLYRNENGTIAPETSWIAVEGNSTQHVAWGDYDQDGDLDLVAGGDGVRLYRNEHGQLTTQGVWSIPTIKTQSIAWGDVDGDGDLDLAAGNTHERTRVYLNKRDTITRNNAPPTIFLEAITPTDTASGYAAPMWDAPITIPITFTLFQRNNQPAQRILAEYSLNGGGTWHPVVATTDTLTTNLVSKPYPLRTTDNHHTFVWDTRASNFFGQSDMVVFRMLALPALRNVDGCVGPFQFGTSATSSSLLRIRSNQIRVFNDTIPVANAMVYRLAADQTLAVPLTNSTGKPLLTDIEGYLYGSNTLAAGDTLIALYPLVISDTFTLYLTNASPTQTGLVADTIHQSSTQNLVVSLEHPLLLFNLDVSLEWDARNDERFMTQLRYDLHRTSEALYDWTNGQAALGNMFIYQDHEKWNDAHIRIYATNRMRPTASQGGIVTQTMTETVILSSTNRLSSPISYEPGQVRMGAIWNRYGEPNGAIGNDWANALAHELGHYVFFLNDNYLGLDSAGRIIPVDTCPGAMTDPYRDDYSEFHPRTDWVPRCALTLSNKETERSDWDTIARFYHWLKAPTTPYSEGNPGPITLPLPVTQLHEVEPVTPSLTLVAPYVSLTDINGKRLQAGFSARAFLFQPERLVDLGRPVQDEVEAKGAHPGDRVCIYEIQAHRLGCQMITTGNQPLKLFSYLDWQPDLMITPVTSHTVVISVTNVATGLRLKSQIYTANSDFPSNTITLTETHDGYTGTITLREPSFEGYVHVWVDETEPRREIVTDYAMGGNPGERRSHRAPEGNPGERRSHRAPLVSSDGQVLLFGSDLIFAKGEFYTFQAATVLPNIPTGRTVVGQAYRITATRKAPSLAGTSISFDYLGYEVPGDRENGLHIYFWNGRQWEQLQTYLNTTYNTASALTQGVGLYALMSSIEVPLPVSGWNLVSYPIHETRPITEALQSIQGLYLQVYGYTTLDTLDPWKGYNVTVPSWVNDLDHLKFGEGYWIRVTKATTLYLEHEYSPILLQEDASSTEELMGQELPQSPATFYGTVQASNDFIPTEGMSVLARIDGMICGQSKTRVIDGQIVYVVDVMAADTEHYEHCGTPEKRITFDVNDIPMVSTGIWDNSQIQILSLSTHVTVYLPLIYHF